MNITHILQGTMKIKKEKTNTEPRIHGLDRKEQCRKLNKHRDETEPDTETQRKQETPGISEPG